MGAGRGTRAVSDHKTTCALGKAGEFRYEITSTFEGDDREPCNYAANGTVSNILVRKAN